MERIFRTLFLFLIAIQGIEKSLSEPFANNDNRSLDSVKSPLEEIENYCQYFSSEIVKENLNLLELANEIVKSTSRELVLVVSNFMTEAASIVKYITEDNKAVLKLPPNKQITRDEEIIQEIFAQYTDAASNTTYYIYPGINGPNYEILRIYIADLITEHVESLKIILTLSENEQSLEDDLSALIKKFQSIFSAFTKYEQSTVLVIANGIFKNNYTDYYSDINHKSRRIEKVKKIIKSNTNNSRNPFTVYFLDNFTKTNKQSLRYIIEDKINFTRKLSDNLKFTISKSSKIMSICLFDEINKDIEVHIMKIKDLIFDYYNQLEEKLNTTNLADMIEFAHHLKEVNKTLSGLDNINGSFKESFKQLFTAIEKLNVQIPPNISEIFFKKAKIFDFLEGISGVLHEPKKCIRPLITVGSDLMYSMNFYSKLVALYAEQRRESIGSVANTKKELLNKVDAILEKSTTVKCSVVNKHQNFYRLEIRGSLLKTSDIGNHACSVEPQFISLYALEKVKIDKDIYSDGKVLQVVIIAPKWEVIGKRVINLNGYNALNDESRANDGGLARNGNNGKPGLPGGPGGLFLGIGKEIRNEESLWILANGGAGGRGQSGGNGGKGINGEPPNPDDVQSNTFYKFSNEEKKLLGSFRTGVIYKVSDCVINGTKDRAAGIGGDGGMGGYGGRRGEIKFFLQKQEKFIHLAVSDGVKGSGGLGGKGGEGGKHGGYMKGRCTSNRVDGRYRKVKGNNRGPNGKNGLDGINVDGRKESIVASGFQPNSFYLNEYKSFFREKSKENIEFYHFLENKTIGEYDVFGFANELKTLEEHYLKLDLEFLEFYESLLRRIDIYVQNYTLNPTNRMPLNFVYTATLSKVALLKKGVDHSLVINIRSYLEMISKSIEKINLKDYYLKVEEYHKEYNLEIEDKCQDAINLINEKIFSAVDDLNSELDHQISDLLEETLQRRENLTKTKDEIENKLINKKLFTTLKSITMVLSFTTFAGPLAGIIAATAADVIEPLFVNENDDKSDVEIPEAAQESYKKANGNLEIWKNEELRRVDYQISFIENEKKDIYKSVNSNSSLLNKVIKLLKDKKKAIENGNLFDNNLQGLKKIEQEMKERANESDTFVSELKALISFQTLASLNFTAYGFDVLKEDKAKIQEMNEALQKANENIDRLRQHEETIHNLLFPILQKMKRDLPTGKILSGKSSAALEVSKWEVQTSLRTTKKILIDSTKGFKVESKVKHFLDDLDATMTTLINVYEKIENYQEEKKLADYIKHISSPVFVNFFQQEGSFGTLIVELQKTIEHNLILVQYQKAIEALKMVVFPFANEYLETLKLPKALEMSAIDDSELLKEVAKSIETWKLKLDMNNYTISGKDTHVVSGPLTVNNKYEEFVYYWKNSENKKMISDLLDGKEVTLFPNASRFKYNAVKFTKLEIAFKSANRSLQEELQQMLNSSFLRMEHQGNSYYKCGSRVYVISHPSLTLIQKFGGAWRNNPAKRISTGNPLISPFATWNVQISADTDEFFDLSAYKNDVDVVFVGYFEYVLDGTNACKHNLSMYYEEYIPIV